MYAGDTQFNHIAVGHFCVHTYLLRPGTLLMTVSVNVIFPHSLTLCTLLLFVPLDILKSLSI